MLKYMPLAGSILLTLIILWIIVYTVRQSRRRVRQALTGTYYRSTCCGSTATPFGWSQDGWISTCDECGNWQYHGDDYDNPPPGFGPSITVQIHADDQATPALTRAREHFADLEQTLSRHPAPRSAAKSPPLDEPQGLASGGVIPCCRMALCTDPIFSLGLCQHHWQWINGINGAGNAMEVTSEPTPYPADCTCHPDDRPAICQHLYALGDCQRLYESKMDPDRVYLGWGLFGHRIDDEGDPLQIPPQPNIGGEDHPPYEGPHYDVPHERFVPYDVIGEPVEGTAVHMIGDTAFAGPLPEIAEWRCVHCKSVVANHEEPKRCIECGRKQFVRIDS